MKMQKIMSGIMMAITLAAGLATLSAPQLASANTSVTDGPLKFGELGLDPAKKTGLGTADVRDTVARIIRVAMSMLGIVAVVIILIGGFTWMTAGGNEEKVSEAKKWIFSGIIGLAIIFSAFAIANFVLKNLYEATTEQAL